MPFTDTFKHPVVQAPDKPQPKTQTVSITKRWADSLTLSPVQFKLYETDGDTYQLVGSVDLDGVQNAEGTYTYTFSDSETEKELYLVENDVGTLPLYSGDEVTINLGEGDIRAAKLILTPDSEPLEITVTNWPKAVMPATGGIGTIWLTAGGLLLILIGSGALIIKRKKIK
jgi:LPXTG-motif cell wall-anchored protein